MYDLQYNYSIKTEKECCGQASTKYIGRQRMKQEGNASGTSRSRHIKCAGNIFSNETVIVSYIVESDGISG